jgi:hypothetical protein
MADGKHRDWSLVKLGTHFGPFAVVGMEMVFHHLHEAKFFRDQFVKVFNPVWAGHNKAIAPSKHIGIVGNRHFDREPIAGPSLGLVENGNVMAQVMQTVRPL